MKAPKAKKIDKILSKHGDQRIDPYFKRKGKPEVIVYLNEENQYTAEVMKDTEDFQNFL